MRPQTPFTRCSSNFLQLRATSCHNRVQFGRFLPRKDSLSLFTASLLAQSSSQEHFFHFRANSRTYRGTYCAYFPWAPKEGKPELAGIA